MGRDHSIECETCGCLRGGMNDEMCMCDIQYLQEAELISLRAQVDVLKQECREWKESAERMRAVYQAAIVWRKHVKQPEGFGLTLCRAINTALARAKEPK